MGPDGPEIDDARARLLVRLRGAVDGQLETALTALADADRLAGLLVDSEQAHDVVAFALALPTALLLADDNAGTALPTGVAGGIVGAVDAPARALARARDWLGTDAIILADVGTSRHAAMEAGEHGADAILFSGDVEAVRDCITWWSGLFVLPVAASASADALDTLTRAGADFLLIEAADLGAADMTPATLARRLQAVEHARAAAARTLLAEDDEDQR